MASIDLRKLEVWAACLEKDIQQFEEQLHDVVRRCGGVDEGELCQLLGIRDYRGLVLDLGRALSLPPHLRLICERSAFAIYGARLTLRNLLRNSWRHGIGHIIYCTLPLLEPLVWLRILWTSFACSRSWIIVTHTLSSALSRLGLLVSNIAFSLIVNLTVHPLIVNTMQWLLSAIWPSAVRVYSILALAMSISLKYWRRAALSHGNLLTMLKLTSAFLRCSGQPAARISVTDAILSRITPIPEKRETTELWVDASPAGPLFCGAAAPGGVMELWHRIDSTSSVDQLTWLAIEATFVGSSDEVLHALTRLNRPPRPILSAVIVATVLRMDLGGRLRNLPNSHLQRELARCKFFSHVPACLQHPRHYIVVTPVNNYLHQEPRIIAGKLNARILEVILGDTSGSSFKFVFVLPACRPGTPQIQERAKLSQLIRDTIIRNHLPERARVVILDDLHTDVVLPNTKGLPLILALRRLCATCAGDDIFALSEMNDSSSWLNISHLAGALPPSGLALATGCRPMWGAGKPVAGHATTRLFSFLFRFLIPNVTAMDSSSVLKVITVRSMRAIIRDLTCLDYAVDQDILAMMAFRGRVVEKRIEWFQVRGTWGHERPGLAQIASLLELSRKSARKRRLSKLLDDEWMKFESGFDFQAMANDRGEVLKGHAPERNRLTMLLTAVCGILKGHEERMGHKEFDRLLPLAARLIGIVGQGPLKRILKVAEGRYRDPLPSILEHLKYTVPVIAETALLWRPRISTPVGSSSPFLFALKQQFATLGTLSSALKWNFRAGDVAGGADMLNVILGLQNTLLSHGLLDPDMKSLLDCGIFIGEAGVSVRHLDFAGFVRDPYIMTKVLPGMVTRIETMRDFRQLARRFRASPEGRVCVVNFRRALEALAETAIDVVASRADTQFAPNPDPEGNSDLLGTLSLEGVSDQVLATARFPGHAPIVPPPFQVLMRQGFGHRARSGSGPSVAKVVNVPFSAPKSTPEPGFVVANSGVADAIRDAMARYLPGRAYNIILGRSVDELPIVSMLRDTAGTRVLMRVGGQSSRMTHLLSGVPGSHKALLLVFGRPLFVHALESMRPLIDAFPHRKWLTHPDTVCFWGPMRFTNTSAPVVAPLPPEAFQLLRTRDRRYSVAPGKVEAIGRLFARYWLTLRTGGYSFPSLVGVTEAALADIRDHEYRLGDRAERDFWAFLSNALDLPCLYSRGRVAMPAPVTWFDIDEPSHLMAFYRHAVVPGFLAYLGVKARPAPVSWYDCVNVGSDVASSPRVEFRRCVFDNSRVSIELDPCIRSAILDGLVIANSQVRIRIAAPVVRNVMISGITACSAEMLRLVLDNQVICQGPDNAQAAVPLPLRP